MFRYDLGISSRDYRSLPTADTIIFFIYYHFYEIGCRSCDALSTSIVCSHIPTSANWGALPNHRIYAPLSVLYHPPIIALGIVALVITTMENIYLAQGLSAAAELAKFFDLEIEYNEDGPAGPDLEAVSCECNLSVEFLLLVVLEVVLIKAFCHDYLEYAQMGLIDPKIVENIDVS